MTYEKSIVGDLINFRGLVYAPMNENGVIYLFGRVTEDLNMYIEEIKPGFPDCIARRFTGKGWERIRIEFEFKSSNFVQHKHDPKGCDMLVCWKHDWKACPIEVIELSSTITDLDNIPITRPGRTYKELDAENTLDELFANKGTQKGPISWWEKIKTSLHAHDEEIWLNIGEKFVGLYSPEKAFVSFQPGKAGLVFKCFTRGEPLKGVKISNKKRSPRWGKFSVKSASDVDWAINTLIICQARIKDAIKAGEPTGYYSGGIPFAKGSVEEDLGTDD